MKKRKKLEIPDVDLLTDEEFEQLQKDLEEKTLMASDDMAELIQETMMIIRQDVAKNNHILPFFGVLTLKARRTPVYVFNKPVLKETFSMGFNDGGNIFINEDFAREIVTKIEEKDQVTALIPYVLHHLSHMIMGHNHRFQHYPSEIVQLGTDLWVYARLKLAYPDLIWPDAFEKKCIGYGMSEAQLKSIVKVSEDTIIAELWNRYKNLYEIQEDAQQKSQESQDEEGDGANENKDMKSKSSAARNNKISKKTLQKALKEMGVKATQEQLDDAEEKDFIKMKEAAEILEEAGCELTLERMDYPETDDENGFEEKNEEIKLRDLEDIEKSIRMEGQAGQKGEGGLGEAAHEEAKKRTEGKISWKLALQEILGESMNYTYSEAEAGSLFYVDPKDMGLNMEIFIGAELPHKKEGTILVLMDTSGSVTEEMLSMFLAEVHGILKNQNPNSDQATEVYLFFADDMLRAKPVILTLENLEEMMENPMNLYGRGGTNLGASLNAVKKLDLLREKKINGIVYFTDLYDTPPRKDQVPEDIPLLFLAPTTEGHEEFIRAVKSFSRVCAIEEGLEIDLKAPVQSPKW